ncbi:dihydrolipoyl dehydrogenase [Alginatibacterium sediminis]|uniref:Dihydrolipoyl dehydrogenase n=1 Tax=Alginatibacterium sediminis TaxID=2164068 RepID=A0A420EN59_9ALTE|nr:dihydrolipoyl dehydrogenase [Alginatibacterium sediminis]RKF22165.1 dihydrolipoyl dehydrogenase [Alginatibacterium sediminis]
MAQKQPNISVDVAVIGGGTAGLAAYRAAKQHSESVLLIEGGEFGTTCARVGCMPSKLLIAAAENAHQYHHSAQFGVNLGKPKIDGKAVMQRVRSERDRFVGFVLESVDSIPSSEKLKGHASFIDNNTLQVGDSIVNAKRIVIATGSRPAFPAAWQSLGSRLVVNDDVFSWEELPSSVAVFGPGVIGLELGQALSRLGVEIKVFGVGGQVGPLSDPTVMNAAKEAFQADFYLDADAKVEAIELDNDQVRISFTDLDGEPQHQHFDYLLAATGRRANVDRLGLDKLSIELDERGVPVVDHFTMQSSVDNIFVAGDANNLIPLLHEAADQGKIAGDNAGRGKDLRAGLRRSSIAAVFTDPQIAMVGESYKQIETRLGSCGCFEIGTVSFENQGRSRVMLVNKGRAHLYGEQGTGRFLGAEIVGPNAEHLAHLLAWAHQQQMTVSQMLDMPFYHPVIEEGLRTALRELNAKLHLGPEMIDACMECGVGA